MEGVYIYIYTYFRGAPQRFGWCPSVSLQNHRKKGYPHKIKSTHVAKEGDVLSEKPNGTPEIHFWDPIL